MDNVMWLMNPRHEIGFLNVMDDGRRCLSSAPVISLDDIRRPPAKRGVEPTPGVVANYLVRASDLSEITDPEERKTALEELGWYEADGILKPGDEK